MSYLFIFLDIWVAKNDRMQTKFDYHLLIESTQMNTKYKLFHKIIIESF